MAETKYDLYIQPTKDTKVYNKPWWKERLKDKWIGSSNLDSKNWKFLKSGLDDFRDDLQPNENDLSQNSSCLGPIIVDESRNNNLITNSEKKTRSTNSQVCNVSKKSRKQEKKLNHVNLIEAQLKQHPLALYPHLEECLPPELFEDVMEILDPEMKSALNDEDYVDAERLNDECEEYEFQPEQYGIIENDSLKDDDDIIGTAISKGSDRMKLTNPYRWILKEDETSKKDKKKGVQESYKPALPAEDDQVQVVTKEFCNWVASLGGDDNNIEESTIASLFASGYETKPPLSVPIHVVELANVPQELRLTTQISRQPTAQELNKNLSARDTQNQDGYTPSWVKYKYGAWYLDPKLWKKRPVNEPLENPKDSSDKEMSEAKSKSVRLDYDLAPMHGTKLFKEFVEKKETRKPEFLDHVSQIQAEKVQEEQRNNLLMEKQKKQKTFKS